MYNKKAYEIFYDEQLRTTKSIKYNNGAIIEISYYEYNKILEQQRQKHWKMTFYPMK